MNFLLFLAPFSWSTQKREAAAPKVSGCFMGGTCGCSGGTGKAEDAKLAELANNIRQHCVLQPILVRPLPDGEAGSRGETSIP